REVAVRDVELDLVEAYAHRQQQLLGDAELVLQEDAVAADRLVLIERHRAALPVDVRKAQPIVVLVVVIEADDEAVRPVEPEPFVAVAQAATDEEAVEIDDAAVRERQ